jgi:hypothetical protein
MIARYNNVSLALGIPGLLLQIGGNFWAAPYFGGQLAVGRSVMALGTLLLIAGLAFYAKAKGRHPAWGLLGLLSFIGLILLACLSDHAKERNLPIYVPRPSDRKKDE